MAIQDGHIRALFPQFNRCRRGGGRAIWRGTLQPQKSSPLYQIEIQYRHKKVPKVRVLSPKLAPNAPHLYKDGSLCLYWPKEWQWNANELIAKTILPWTASWLFFYELWLDCGIWFGPSSHDELVQ